MTSADIREVAEGRQYQGEDEIVVYTVDVTNVGSSPTAVSVAVFDTSQEELDVTATAMPVNSPAVVANVITLSPLRALVAPHIYRVEIKFTVGGNVLEHYFTVKGQ